MHLNLNSFLQSGLKKSGTDVPSKQIAKSPTLNFKTVPTVLSKDKENSPTLNDQTQNFIEHLDTESNKTLSISDKSDITYNRTDTHISKGELESEIRQRKLQQEHDIFKSIMKSKHVLSFGYT